MNGPEHYREAEKLLGYAEARDAEQRGDAADLSFLAEAQAHATLADAAATADLAFVNALAHDINSRAIDDWMTVLGDAVAGQPAEADTEPSAVYVYRAEHPDAGITLGHYATASAARAHCEATAHREVPGASHHWIEDEEDGVAELVAAEDGAEFPTGYIVTALELASVYDEEADE